MPHGQFHIHPGDVVAHKYRVDKVLGAGGMGMVVSAQHLHLGQMVALKFMLPGAIENPTALERFFREAQAAFRLASEHVARVLDVGTLDNGAPYIVMEYLSGTNFADLLENGPALSVSRAVDFVLQASEALAEAHSLGIVHRDLKPANLFLTTRPDGTPLVKVLDFGISKLNTTGHPDGALTKTGRAIGSPQYMAPEQITNPKSVDRRADIWGLGVLLYELVSKRVPFEATSIPELCLKVVRDRPTPLEGKAYPGGFVDLIYRCLEKEPSKRFADVGELAEVLAFYSESGARTSLKRIGGVTRMEKTPAPVVTTQPTRASAVPTVDEFHIDIEISDGSGELGSDELGLGKTQADSRTKHGI
jgi:eukaryotic-like serine/threonine-protein kinase